MRVYIPYGTDWYGQLMRRLAKRPTNVAFFLRAVASRRPLHDVSTTSALGASRGRIDLTQDHPWTRSPFRRLR